MKKFEISSDQITALLNTIYSTNIPAQAFDGLKKFFEKLPEIVMPPSNG